MKGFEYASTILGTAGATLLGASIYLGDVFEFSVLSGTMILLSGAILGVGIAIENRKRDVHFREKMDVLRLKKH